MQRWEIKNLLTILILHLPFSFLHQYPVSFLTANNAPLFPYVIHHNAIMSDLKAMLLSN